MKIDIVDSVDVVSGHEFDRLDHSAGVAGSFARVRQHEADRRWLCRYVRALVDGQFVAMIPLYRPRGRTWTDARYDPVGWSLPPCPPSSALLVGGCCDLRSGFPIDASFQTPDQIRPLLIAIAQIAAAEERGLVFPYWYQPARQAVTLAADGAIIWADLEPEARLTGVSSPDWEDRVHRRIRYNVRHDRRLISDAGLTSGLRTWAEVESAASELIAEHSQRKGHSEHAELVKLRNRRWIECAGVEFIVFESRVDEVTGYATGLIWQEQLEMYEIGLGGPTGTVRKAAYLDLAFRQPLELARERGLDTIRLGPTAEQVKAGRGATFHRVSGGVLTPESTAALAGSVPAFAAGDVW